MSKAFELAKEMYAAKGVDVEQALAKLDQVVISLHAWQGDDVIGFENVQHAHTGGCQVTGNYPGRARTANELRQDLDLVLKLLPGTQKVNLQAHQVDRVLPGQDRDSYTLENYSDWLSWAQSQKIGLDIAPAFYSHPKLDHGFSLSHPDKKIRKFWINHGIAVRKVAAELGKKLKTPSIVNFWMPDGSKDLVVDRYSPRIRMRDSLDECFAPELPAKYTRDAVESKLFGIGTESYTVTSNEFCLAYAMRRNKMVCFDMGHFHPTESVGDKLSAIFCEMKEVMLHVSRGVRWDSDHVLVINDDLLNVAREAAAYDYLNKIHYSLDYFDASINRIAAMVIGCRAFQKSLLIALLEPYKKLEGFEKSFDYTSRLAEIDNCKNLPWGIIWDHYCMTHNVPGGTDYMSEIKAYEKKVLLARG